MNEIKDIDPGNSVDNPVPEAEIKPVTTPEATKPKKRGPGRPRKSEIQAKTPGNRKKVGRPKGDAAIINEFKARMLASPKSKAVLEKIFDAALDDEHKHQSAAWKLLADRIAPVSAFESEVKKGGGGNSIKIEISGVPGVKIGNDEPVEGQWEEL